MGVVGEGVGGVQARRPGDGPFCRARRSPSGAGDFGDAPWCACRRVESDHEAAAIPERFITAWDAVWLQAGVKESQTLLIHAVGSGRGHRGVQLARAFGVEIGGHFVQPSFKLDAAIRARGLEGGCWCAILRGRPSAWAAATMCLDLWRTYFPEDAPGDGPRGTVIGGGAHPRARPPKFPLRRILAGACGVDSAPPLRSRRTKERTELTRPLCARRCAAVKKQN